MQPMLSVFAKITPKPEHLDSARQAILDILEVTRCEAGCQQFSLHEGLNGDDSLYLMEVWQDEQALAAHYEQPYTKHVFEAYQEWLAKPVEVKKMRPTPSP